MPWPKLIVLVRHAESEGNVRTAEERTKYPLGTWQYPLTERGRQQASITGDYLRSHFGAFDVNYTSYYERAKETMNLLYPGANVREDPRLAEAQRGIWHTMTVEEMQKYYPGELERKEREGLYHYRPFGGENWPDVEMRVHSMLGTLRRECGKEKVLIVVHGHWLILLQRLIHHFSIDEALRRYKGRIFENASVTIYEEQAINETSRLVLKQENIIPWKGML